VIIFDKSVCSDLSQALKKEWLETNGLGGFASSTIAGLNTRRYHGLLVAATAPPVGRKVILSKLEETLVAEGQSYELSANQYPDVVHPKGHELLREFRLRPFPTFVYEAGGLRLTKTVFMVHGENTTVITYSLTGGRRIVLHVRPLVAFRDFHHLTRENADLKREVEVSAGVLKFQPYPDAPALLLAHSPAELETEGCWYRNFEYAEEKSRGLDFREDLYSPGVLHFDLNEGDKVLIIASLHRQTAADAVELAQKESARRRGVERALPKADDFTRSLLLAADQFLVKRDTGKSIIAGYPWFGDWGRDAMIAFPGLTLVTRRFGDARDVLRSFVRACEQGMIPNFFGEGGQPEFNAVDATLWLFQAVRNYMLVTRDHDFVKRELFDALVDILRWHIEGTRHGIRMDSDGLLVCGEEGVQLTWMDAKVGDRVITQRRGKPVEVEALWHAALKTMAWLAHVFGRAELADRCGQLAEKARAAFNQVFWNESARCLYDCVDQGRPDPSIRPNQILAVSLPYTLLSRGKQWMVVNTVQDKLLTPYGLRTLAPDDSGYRGRYEGDQAARDEAYHQGTVWPWLLGPFATAYVKVRRWRRSARAEAAQLLKTFAPHLADAGLGSISEVFDGDAPHAPKGCIAQAWSVAEILRAYHWDVQGFGPDRERYAAGPERRKEDRRPQKPLDARRRPRL